MKFLTDFTYRNLHGFAQFPGDSTALVSYPQVTREPSERRELPQRGLGRRHTRECFWSTQFCVILRVLVHFGNRLLQIITPKYKKIENITGVGKVVTCLQFSSGSNAIERPQQEKIGEKDRQTIK